MGDACVHDGDRAGSYATSLVTSFVLAENLLPHPLLDTPTAGAAQV
jgi:hypothetical protein